MGACIKRAEAAEAMILTLRDSVTSAERRALDAESREIAAGLRARQAEDAAVGHVGSGPGLVGVRSRLKGGYNAGGMRSVCGTDGDGNQRARREKGGGWWSGDAGDDPDGLDMQRGSNASQCSASAGVVSLRRALRAAQRRALEAEEALIVTSADASHWDVPAEVHGSPRPRNQFAACPGPSHEVRPCTDGVVRGHSSTRSSAERNCGDSDTDSDKCDGEIMFIQMGHWHGAVCSLDVGET